MLSLVSVPTTSNNNLASSLDFFTSFTDSMADSADFKKAAEDVRNLKGTPSNDDYSKLYSLFKQATAGDCTRAVPSSTDLLEKGKYDAWIVRKGESQADAAAQYIAEAKAAVTKYGLK